MVPTTHKVCFALIAIAMTLFFLAYYHSWYINDSLYIYAEKMAWLSSFFSSAEPLESQHWVGNHAGFYEDRAILIMFVISGGIVLVAAALAVCHRLKIGRSRFFIPLTVLCAVMLGTIIKVGYEFGLHNHA